MAFDVGEILGRDLQMEVSYGDRDVMLYALGLGLGRDPSNTAELGFVYEKNLRIVPTFATILSFTAQLIRPDDDLDATKLVHGEQRLDLHRSLPTRGTVVVEARITKIIDKGPGRGLLIVQQNTVALKETGERLATVEAVVVYRADGGKAGTGGTAPAAHPIPDRAPDAVATTPTRPDQAFLYRLSGDRNPLHVDSDFAKRAGFERPILHGLCTYGIACCAVMRSYCPDDARRIRGFDARFTAPLYPGETLTTEMWLDGDIVSFRCRSKQRDVVVLNNGKSTLGA